MMNICALFDKYRDGELSQVEANEFEAHLAECADCRMKRALLNNIALILKSDPAVMPADLSGRIAEKAFHPSNSWDSILLGWLRPGPAFAALSLICILFASLWIVPSYKPANAFSEYEKLMDEANTVNLNSSISRIQSEAELVVWLEQEAKSQ